MALVAGVSGIPFVIVCKNDQDEFVDLASFTTLEYQFKDPDGVIMERTAFHLTDGQDGQLVYTLLDGDIPETKYGRWKYRAHVQKPGSNWYSEWLVQNFDPVDA